MADLESVFPKIGTQEQIDEIKRMFEDLQAALLSKGRSSVRFASESRRVLAPPALVAGEAIANGDAVRIALTNELARQLLTGSSSENISGTNRSAQSFTWPVAATTLKIIARFDNADAGGRTVNANIHADSSGSPGSVLYGPVSQSISNNVTDVELTFDFGGVALTAGTTYWIVFDANGSNVDVDFGGTANAAFATHKKSTNSGSTWPTTVATELYIKLYVTEDNTKIYKADAQTQNLADLYLGIADGAANALGESINIIVEGFKEDYADTISVGSKYYLTDTRGTIGTTAGTISLQVGVGLTAKILYIHRF